MRQHPILEQRRGHTRGVLVEPDPRHPYGARINVSGPFNWYQLLCMRDERGHGEIVVRLPRRVYVGYYGELTRWPRPVDLKRVNGGPREARK